MHPYIKYIAFSMISMPCNENRVLCPVVMKEGLILQQPWTQPFSS